MNDSEYKNPFDEEFDEKDVVNRDDVFTPFDDDSDDGKNSSQKVIDPSTLADIISDGENLTIQSKEDDDEFFGIIKKEDIDKGNFQIEEIDKEYSVAPDNDDLLSHLHDDIQNEKNTDNNDDNSESPNEENNKKFEELKKPEEVIEEYLQKNFRDFLSIPKISGNLVKSSDHNLIPKDFVSKTGKTIEIADDLPATKDNCQQTSVIINRDENGELESMEVICKCGERTLIKFDYTTAKDIDNELTEIDANEYDPIPFHELKKEHYEQFMVSPDLILKNFDEEEENDVNLDEEIEDDDENWEDELDSDDEDEDDDEQTKDTN